MRGGEGGRECRRIMEGDEKKRINAEGGKRERECGWMGE